MGTPDPVAAALVQWAVRSPSDRLLDPSCGDGRFIARHSNSTGVERNENAAAAAGQRAPCAVVHQGDFFEWAEQSAERFDCAAGNPPFIRYQTFAGEVRRRALRLCDELGARFSGLTTSWAPFLVVTASLLRRGGRMAFVVPASIGHAPHAAPLIDYLVANFDVVRIVPIRRKLFPRSRTPESQPTARHLSEDCWLLFAEGFGGSTRDIHFAPVEQFRDTQVPPRVAEIVPVEEWRGLWNRRLRPYLLNDSQRVTYMSGIAPSLVRNEAGATCTNALHAVHLRDARVGHGLLDAWGSTYVRLSCEIEGHALGGGMLKLEPGEAARVVLPSQEATSCLDDSLLEDAVSTLRSWRHYGLSQPSSPSISASLSIK